MRVRNSSRVFCCVRKQPSIHEVVVIEPGFCTPRIVMHKWLYTGTTARKEGRKNGWSWDVSEDTVEGKRCRVRTYVASMTTATPRGLMASCTQRAICFVRRSCTWRRRLKVSAMRASFEMPKTSLFGMYAMAICGCGADGTP